MSNTLDIWFRWLLICVRYGKSLDGLTIEGPFKGSTYPTFLERVTKWSSETCGCFSDIWLAWFTNLLGGLLACHRVAVFQAALLWRRSCGNFLFLVSLCQRSSKIFGGTDPRLREIYWEEFSLYSWFVFLWQRRFRRAASLISNRIFDVAVFPRVLWRGEDKIELIEEFLVILFGGFINDLTCQVVTLKSSLRFSYGYFI